MCTAESVGRIENEPEVVPARNLAQRFNIACMPPQMNTDNAGRPRGNHLLNSFGVECWIVPLNVAKDRRDLLPLKSMGRGNESKRGNNDFTTEAQSANRDLQGHGSIADSNAVFYADEIGDAVLEFLSARAAIS